MMADDQGGVVALGQRTADAEKADGARMEALQNPKLPDLIGRIACSRELPCSKSILVHDPGKDGLQKVVPGFQEG